MSAFLRWTSRFLMFGLAAGLLVIAMSHLMPIKKFDPDRDSLKYDFGIQMFCYSSNVPRDEFWEDAFIQLGFRPLNPAALAKKYGIDYPVNLHPIWGLGPGDRILEVYQTSPAGGYVSVGLDSPPPTVHDAELETALRNVAGQTQCKLVSVRTDENKSQSLPVFLKLLKIVNGWYAEADAMEHR